MEDRANVTGRVQRTKIEGQKEDEIEEKKRRALVFALMVEQWHS